MNDIPVEVTMLTVKKTITKDITTMDIRTVDIRTVDIRTVDITTMDIRMLAPISATVDEGYGNCPRRQNDSTVLEGNWL